MFITQSIRTQCNSVCSAVVEATIEMNEKQINKKKYIW